MTIDNACLSVQRKLVKWNLDVKLTTYVSGELGSDCATGPKRLKFLS